MRVRSVPLQPCRRHGKKRRDDDLDSYIRKRDLNSRQSPLTDPRLSRPSSAASDSSHGFEGIDSQVQSSQVSSTVLDSPFQAWHCNPVLNPSQNMPIDAMRSPCVSPWYPTISSTVTEGK